jgi:hypothetical protein
MFTDVASGGKDRPRSRPRPRRPAALMSAAPRPELAADLELGAVCTTSPPIAATVVLAAMRRGPSSDVCTTSPPIAAAVVLAVLLVELELGDRRADVGRAAACSSSATAALMSAAPRHELAADLELAAARRRPGRARLRPSRSPASGR